MRTGISITVSPSDCHRLQGLARDRSAAQKHVDTNEIMRRTGKSKTCVWRWQERFAAEGFAGLLRDKTRPPSVGFDPRERDAQECEHFCADNPALPIGSD